MEAVEGWSWLSEGSFAMGGWLVILCGTLGLVEAFIAPDAFLFLRTAIRGDLAGVGEAVADVLLELMPVVTVWVGDCLQCAPDFGLSPGLLAGLLVAILLRLIRGVDWPELDWLLGPLLSGLANLAPMCSQELNASCMSGLALGSCVLVEEVVCPRVATGLSLASAGECV